MDKVTFRKHQMDRLTDFANTDEKKAEEVQLAKRLYQLSSFQNAESVGITISQPLEFDTKPLIKAITNLGKKVFVPKTLPHRQMAFLPYPDDEKSLVKSSFGIPEPVYDAQKRLDPPDLMIVPGLAFCEANNQRLGFGAGYYDRYLTLYPANTVALVLSPMYFQQPAWQISMLDVPLDELLIPEKKAI